MITADELRIEELRLRYLDLLESENVYLTRSNWQFITENKMKGLGRPLYTKYLEAVTIDDNDRQQFHDIAEEEFPKYIAAIERDEALSTVYSDIETAPNATIGLICSARLFDARYILGILRKGNFNFAVRALEAYQPEYSSDDLNMMEQILGWIDNLPMLGTYEEKSGILGRSEKYICPNGHANPMEARYCRHAGCGQNIRGLTEEQEQAVDIYRRRLSALKRLL